MSSPAAASAPTDKDSFSTRAQAVLDSMASAAANEASGALSWVRLLSNVGLSTEGKMARLYRMGRQARVNEEKRQFRRADFCWNTLRNELKSLLDTEKTQAESLQAHPDRALYVTSVAQAVLVNAHLSAYDAWTSLADKAQAPVRQEAHLQYLHDCLPSARMSSDEQEQAIAVRMYERMHEAAQAGDWDIVRKHGNSLIRDFPDRLRYRLDLAELLWQECAKKLNDASNPSERLLALNPVIKKIEELRSETIGRRERQLTDRLRDLYHIKAAQLANDGNISDALLACRKAICCDEYSQDLVELWQKLVESMQSLMSKAKEILGEIENMRARGLPQHLTVDGENLIAQAKAGFGPVNAFADSVECSDLERDAKVARARSLWARINLGPLPPDDDFVMRAVDAIVSAFAKVKSEPQQASSQVWASTVGADSSLSVLDSGRVNRFINARLANEDFAEPTSDPLPPRLEPSFKMNIDTGKAKRQRLEPIEWLFDSGHRVLKIVTLAVLAGLALLSVFAVRDQIHRGVRDVAYADLRTAMVARDYNRAMNDAARFLRATTFAKDLRETEVRESYAEALVRWVQNQPTAPSSSDARLVEYHRLSR